MSEGIHAAISAIMAEIEPVGKTRENKGQNYKFRGIADVYKATQRIMAKHRVHISPHEIHEIITSERESKNGGAMFTVRAHIAFRMYHEDGSFVQISTIGEGMDSGDKASNKAMSAAMKYALIQAFALPEEQPDDSENESPEVAPKPAPKLFMPWEDEKIISLATKSELDGMKNGTKCKDGVPMSDGAKWKDEKAGEAGDFSITGIRKTLEARREKESRDRKGAGSA